MKLAVCSGLAQLASVVALSKTAFLEKSSDALLEVEEKKDFPLRDVFLFAGQSNCVGVAQLTDLPVELAGDVPNLYGWPKTMGKSWNPYKMQEANGFNLNGAFGPEVSFVHTLAPIYEKKQESFGITKVAKIGTSLHKDWALTDWASQIKDEQHLTRLRKMMFAPLGTQDEPYLFPLFLESARSAMNSTQCDGGRCKIKGLLWVQGEADATLQVEDAKLYGDLLDKFMTSVRIALESPDLFIMIAQLHPDMVGQRQNPGAQEVINGQMKFTQNEGPKRAAFIPTDGVTKLEDDLHYDAAGEVLLGKRAAQAYIEAMEQ
jgi:hypothetical protein